MTSFSCHARRRAAPAWGLGVVLGAALALAGATGATGAARAETVRIAYVTWSSAIATANVVKVMIEDGLGHRADLIPVSAETMWRSVAEGRADVMLSAWLPSLHAHYLERFRGSVDDLGPNLVGTRTGLVVPNVASGRQTAGSGLTNRRHITVESIADLKTAASRVGNRIIGIDPEAGIMAAAARAIEAYGLDGIELIAGSEDAMTAALGEAIRRRRWVVVTGWQPHWMFGQWNLRYLDDPEGVFGGAEAIHTIARRGLADDLPPALFAALDRFAWTPDEMEILLVRNQRGDAFPADTARAWIAQNPARLAAWLGADG